MEIHDQCFASTKKGGRRKTVSKRRAYVNTPSQNRKSLNTSLIMIATALEDLDRKQYRRVFSTLTSLHDSLTNQKMDLDYGNT